MLAGSWCSCAWFRENELEGREAALSLESGCSGWQGHSLSFHAQDGEAGERTFSSVSVSLTHMAAGRGAVGRLCTSPHSSPSRNPKLLITKGKRKKRPFVAGGAGLRSPFKEKQAIQLGGGRPLKTLSFYCLHGGAGRRESASALKGPHLPSSPELGTEYGEALGPDHFAQHSTFLMDRFVLELSFGSAQTLAHLRGK